MSDNGQLGVGGKFLVVYLSLSLLPGFVPNISIPMITIYLYLHLEEGITSQAWYHWTAQEQAKHRKNVDATPYHSLLKGPNQC